MQADWQREILNSFVSEKIDDLKTTYNTTVRGSVVFRLNELVEMEEVLTSVTLRCPPFLEKLLENNKKQNNLNLNYIDSTKNRDESKKVSKKTISKSVYEEIARLKGIVKSKTVKKGKIKNAGNECDEESNKGGLQEEEVKKYRAFLIYPAHSISKN